MGFISFITNDTKRSIPNCYSNYHCFTVYLIDNKGNIWEDNSYGGYGTFMGKDFFVLIAEMNGKKTREEGVHIYNHKDEKTALFPNIVTDRNWNWVNEKPKDCRYQGYFY
jgi:hypothetical protein